MKSSLLLLKDWRPTLKLKSLGDKSKRSKESAHGYNTDNTDPRARRPGFLSPLEVT